MIEISDSTILVIAAHPDDEVLGCGGSVHKWTETGARIHALILAEGLTSRAIQRSDIPQDLITALHEDAKRAADIIGYSSISFEAFPDNRMDSVDLLDIIHILNRYIERIQPNMILTHHHGDLNIDHRICFQAAITACRPLQDCPVQAILSYETPYPRAQESLRAIAQRWGSVAGCYYAEPFELVRMFL